MRLSNIEVSIVCLTYNHQKYIRQALESFISQETNFSFEVIVHDDASTDDTPKIILEYAERYPQIIKPILQTENQYSQRKPIHKLYTLPMVSGKYVALCEGDDFWTDVKKLQKQYEVMENNLDCSMCVHTVQEIYKDGSPSTKKHPNFVLEETKIKTQKYLDIKDKYPFQTSSYFMKSDLWKQLYLDPPKFRQISLVGDEPLLLFMVANGNIFYLSECMSCYRIFSEGSFSERIKKDRKKRATYKKNLYDVLCLFDEYTNHQYNCHLALYRGSMLLYQGNYREILKKENREYFSHLSIIKKIYVLLCIPFPFLDRFFDKLI